MRKGDIVRKIFADHIPYGDYGIVNRSKGSFAEITYISSGAVSMCILKSRLKVLSKASLAISDDLFKRLEEGKTFIISHDMSPRWKNAYDKGPDLIVVHTQGGKRATYTVLSFNLVSTIHGTKRIQVELGRRLL